MSVSLMPLIWFQPLVNGATVPGGLVYFYAAGTLIAQTVYTDHLGLVPHTNPVELDGHGKAVIYFAASSYKVVIRDADGTLLDEQDNVQAIPAITNNVDVQGTLGEAVVTNNLLYQSDGSDGGVQGRWYKTDSDDVKKSTHPIMLGFGTATGALGASGSIRRGGVMEGFVGLTPGAAYYASSTPGGITAIRPTNARLVGVADASGTSLILVCSSGDGVAQPHIVEGRLTLATGDPVPDADVSAAGTFYYTPYLGNRVTLYTTAAGWRTRHFSEVSLAVPALSRMHDVYLYDNAGTLTIETLAWATNDTVPSRDTLDGILVKSGDPTRLFVGVLYPYNVSFAEDSDRRRHLWNYYNRVRRHIQYTPTLNNIYAHTGDGTWQYGCGGIGNSPWVEVAQGGNSLLDLRVTVGDLVSTLGTGTVEVGLTQDLPPPTAAPALPTKQAFIEVMTAGVRYQVQASYMGRPAPGLRDFYWAERAPGGTNFEAGGAPGGVMISGFEGTWEC